MGQSERRVFYSDGLRPIAKVQKTPSVGTVHGNDQTIMGVHINTHRVENKQHHSNTNTVRVVRSSLYLSIIKRLQKMATAKMMLFFFDFLGVPIFLYTSILNFGEFKGWVLFFIAALYGVARLFFFVDKQRDESRMRKLQLKKKEHDVNDELNED